MIVTACGIAGLAAGIDTLIGKGDKAIMGIGPNPDLWADHDWQDFIWDWMS